MFENYTTWRWKCLNILRVPLRLSALAKCVAPHGLIHPRTVLCVTHSFSFFNKFFYNFHLLYLIQKYYKSYLYFVIKSIQLCICTFTFFYILNFKMFLQKYLMKDAYVFYLNEIPKMHMYFIWVLQSHRVRVLIVKIFPY